MRYLCEQCEQSYNSKQSLEHHIQYVHEKWNVIVFTVIPNSRRQNLTKNMFNLIIHHEWKVVMAIPSDECDSTVTKKEV